METTDRKFRPEEIGWEAMEEDSPAPGFLENVALPSVLILGILSVVVGIADALFFRFLSGEADVAHVLGGILGIIPWIYNKMMEC